MDALHYSRVIRMAVETPWAITPDKMAAIVDLLTDRAIGVRYSADEIAQRIGADLLDPEHTAAAGKPTYQQSGDVAVVPLYGTITPRANMMTEFSGGTSAERFAATINDLSANPQISAIVIDVDSPGGNVLGVQEAAAAVRAARARKPVLAIANHLAASAAYWIASQATEFSATPSGEVGSIGVFAVHEDVSEALTLKGVKPSIVSAGKYKVEANPFAPLSDEARAFMQSRVDEIYQLFTADVARGRRVSVAEVRGGFGEGRVLGSTRARALGMVDRVETFDAALRRALRGEVGRSSPAASSEYDIDDDVRLAAAAAGAVAPITVITYSNSGDITDTAGDPAPADEPAPFDNEGLIAAIREAIRKG